MIVVSASAIATAMYSSARHMSSALFGDAMVTNTE